MLNGQLASHKTVRTGLWNSGTRQCSNGTTLSGAGLDAANAP